MLNMRLSTRKFKLASIALVLFIAPAHANDKEPLYGKWGTEAQCAGELITPKGTKRASPFDFQSQWLRNGEVWCRMNWGVVDKTEGGLFTVAQGQCGEDSVRGYNINFRLVGDELTLVWNLWHKVGPLMRCDK